MTEDGWPETEDEFTELTLKLCAEELARQRRGEPIPAAYRIPDSAVEDPFHPFWLDGPPTAQRKAEKPA